MQEKKVLLYWQILYHDLLPQNEMGEQFESVKHFPPRMELAMSSISSSAPINKFFVSSRAFSTSSSLTGAGPWLGGDEKT